MGLCSLAGYSNGVVVVLRRDTGEVVARQQSHSAAVTRLAIAQSSRGMLTFASGDESGAILIHALDSKTQEVRTKVGLACGFRGFR